MMVVGEMTRRERKKEETKKKIMQIALDLFYKKGFENTTMEEIAEKADIAKGTLYNYFSVKEAIIVEYVHGSIKVNGQEAIQALSRLSDTRSRITAIFNRGIQWIEDNLEFYQIYTAFRLRRMFNQEEGKDERSDMSFILAKVIQYGQEMGELRNDMDPLILANQLEAIQAITVLVWLSNPKEFLIEENTLKNIDLFLYGAISNKYEGRN